MKWKFFNRKSHQIRQEIKEWKCLLAYPRHFLTKWVLSFPSCNQSVFPFSSWSFYVIKMRPLLLCRVTRSCLSAILSFSSSIHLLWLANMHQTLQFNPCHLFFPFSQIWFSSSPPLLCLLHSPLSPHAPSLLTPSISHKGQLSTETGETVLFPMERMWCPYGFLHSWEFCIILAYRTRSIGG